MAEILTLQCSICGKNYSDTMMYTCPSCGEVGTLDVLYDYTNLSDYQTAITNSNVFSMWRYKPLLPLEQDSVFPPLRVGFTPLYDAPRLAKTLGIKQVWVKDDGLNPTGSLKDRASSLVVARALEQNISIVTTASTGNAAAALAGVAASVGMRPIIFVPAAAPEAKIAQLLVYGAIVLLVEDSYDVAFDLCMKISQQEGWYCRNTGVNPFTTEGKKTVAYEIAEQLNWQVPDAIVVSVGDGNIIAGVYKGFYDLVQMGWIQRIPRLIGVQSSTSAPLVNAWQHNMNAVDMQPIMAHSIADSIVAGLPRDRSKALRAVNQTDGAFIAVDDSEILQAIPQFARLTGVFAEPAAAAAWAGAQRARSLGLLHADEQVVILSTGSGLKDVRRAQESVAQGIHVKPDIKSIKSALQELI
ncbi:MAG: threonine synthase [Phototrophicales bacterium]|nr:MAG: threonine synthase [Phototrophicales bacterium]